ncbi:TrmH family RNA methyltransferase [Actinophytocola gossypii]|uniref:RNA methyltransferase n=1 Tax=Actinophytocola gossypii TaxID=2812003 RepID=A0ABT2JK79_9PSEU|nr:RNA methyltransferase [Actinophytocola gossypii]MCT2588293.1 RNA methyltransferase [Actinophytocola gossypii]
MKRVRLLADRKHRKREGAFFVEGVRSVWQAVDAGAEIETLIVSTELLGDSPALGVVEDLEGRGVRVAHLTADLFLRLSDRDGPSGLAAIVRSRLFDLAGLAVRPDAIFVALNEIANPGNVGTIIRTADSINAAGVILLGQTTDPFAPAAVKASMGALFTVPIAHSADAGEFFAWARERGVSVATTSARAESDHWATEYPMPLALLMGSEGDGLPGDLMARGDLRVRIPMVGAVSSLNLAVATGILLYEVRRQQVGPDVTRHRVTAGPA